MVAAESWDDFEPFDDLEGADADAARRSLAEFCRQAVAAGEVEGTSELEWGPHLEALALHTQLQLEGWLVSYGKGTPDMVRRQREAWERTKARSPDGKPEPWLRQPLVLNQLYNICPSSWKSSMVMVCANAWIWLWEPTFHFVASSGIDANVSRDSNAARTLVKSDWYRTTFQVSWTDRDLEPDELPPDIEMSRAADAVSFWATTAGGRRSSRTWSRGLTGLHGDGIFGDDPDDADKVFNEPARVSAQNRWSRAMENRVNDERRTIRLIMQQVVHPEGFSAYLLSIAVWSPTNIGGWSRLCIPAEYGRGPVDAPVETPYGWKDWRTQPGETMHPRLTVAVLADRRLKMPWYEAQYNQNAERGTDGDFKPDAVRFFLFEGETTTRRRPEGCLQRDELPPRIIRRADLDRWTLNVDTAGSLEPDENSKGSAVGLTVGACIKDDRFVVDDRTRMLGPHGTYLAIYELIGAWPLDEILVEFKTIGAGVIAEVERSINRGWYLNAKDERVELVGPDGKRPRCVVKPFNPGKDSKEQRHQGMLPAWSQHEIYLHDGADWLYPQHDVNRRTVDEGFLGEICALPHSRKTERADMLAQFIMHFRGTANEADKMRALNRLALLGQRRRARW